LDSALAAAAAAPTLIPFNGLPGADVEVAVAVEGVVLAAEGEPDPKYPLFFGGAMFVLLL
jgi:hypothetical protein